MVLTFQLKPPSVDGLVKCNTQIITSAEESLNTTGPTNTKPANVSHEGAAFQFVEGNPFIATFWAGGEGFHTTVNGRHETSFAYREVILLVSLSKHVQRFIVVIRLIFSDMVAET